MFIFFIYKYLNIDHIYITEHKLMDMECPQRLKTDRLARGRECIFAYKRNDANIAWPKFIQA